MCISTLIMNPIYATVKLHQLYNHEINKLLFTISHQFMHKLTSNHPLFHEMKYRVPWKKVQLILPNYRHFFIFTPEGDARVLNCTRILARTEFIFSEHAWSCTRKINIQNKAVQIVIVLLSSGNALSLQWVLAFLFRVLHTCLLV